MRIVPFVLVLTAVAMPIAAAASALQPALIEPAAGADLAAGSTAVIAWDAARLPANVEEWEAFLSIDGGRTYPLRLTPHLDQSIRRFQWTVPNTPGAEVTILLRLGDEKDEVPFTFARRARISGVATALDSLTRPPPIEAAGLGEPVEEGGAGVAGWVEGGRDGSALREVYAARASSLHSGGCRASRSSEPVAAAAAPRERHAPHPIHERTTADERLRSARSAITRECAVVADILLSSTRLNI
ncbi:MAG TPA: hypothetical protein VF980_12870 [Thermoanaerobaculia bacterium]